ncbi:MAG: hypothetical protein ACXAD7_11695 [Candidatus Kariarchaeaceae archaeon]|jgi:hypothetical protein
MGSIPGDLLPGDIIFSIVENFKSSGYPEEVIEQLPKSYTILHLDDEVGMKKWLKIIYKTLFPLLEVKNGLEEVQTSSS